MITPINNYQLNQSFCASIKTPKIKGGIKQPAPVDIEKTSKFKSFMTTIKKEYSELDEDSKDKLWKSVLFLSLAIGGLTYVGYYVKIFVDKINNILDLF